MDQRKVDYLDFKKKVLDPISSTFCAAKWYEVTLWLYMKSGASCHHNPLMEIPLQKEPWSLHNTEQKLIEREMMLRGERPTGCNYCWNAEDAGTISDRIQKSYGYKDFEISANIPKKVNPKKLEIAFSRSCQLACAYCGPSFSSSWANDLNKNGSYNLRSDTRFNRDIKNKLIPDDENLHIQQFFDWWAELKSELLVLRVTGGEPLLHPRFWDFLDMIHKQQDYRGAFVVNSNLIHEKGQVQKLIEKTRFLAGDHVFRRVEIHTSCESSMAHAEYTRDGFKADIWNENVKLILDTSNIYLTVTTAINNMSVWSLVDYIKMIAELREQYGVEKVTANFNRVLHPQWNQIALIPAHYRKDLICELEETFNSLPILHDEMMYTQFNEFIEYFKSATFYDVSCVTEHVLIDLVLFYDKFNLRRKKDISVLDPRFVEWVETLREKYFREGTPIC